MHFFSRFARWFSSESRTRQTTRPEQMNQLIHDARRAYYAEQYDDALRYLNQAADIADEIHNQTAKVTIDLTRGDILIAQHQYDEAEKWIQTLKEEAEGRQHYAPQAYALVSLGVIAQHRHNWDTAHQYYEQARDLASSINAGGAEGRATAHLADVYLHEGNASYARHLLEGALEKLHQSGDNELLSYFTARLGEAVRLSGEYYKGLDTIQQALQIATAIQHRAQIRRINLLLGAAALHQRDYLRARTYYQEAIDHFSAENTTSIDYAKAAMRLSAASRHLGESDRARTLAADALAIITPQDDPHLHAQAQGIYALALDAALDPTDEEAAEDRDHIRDQLQQAADTYADQPADTDYVYVLRRLAAHYTAQGQPDRAQHYYDRAAAAATALHLDWLQADVHHDIGNFYIAQQQLDNALTHYEKALTHYEEANLPHQIARLHCDIGVLHIQQGETRRALKHFESAATQLSNVEDGRIRGIVLANLATAYSDYGDLESAEEFFKEAIELAQAVDDPDAEARRRGNYGRLLALTDRPKQAITFLMQARNWYNQHNLTRQAALQIHNMGIAYAALGNYEKARDHHQDALAQTDDPRWQADAHVRLADALYHLGEMAAAADHYARAHILATEQHHLPVQIQATIGQARLKFESQQYTAAAELLDTAYQLAKRHQLRREQAHIFTLQSQLSIALDEPAKARAAWDEAARLRRIAKLPALKPDWL